MKVGMVHGLWEHPPKGRGLALLLNKSLPTRGFLTFDGPTYIASVFWRTSFLLQSSPSLASLLTSFLPPHQPTVKLPPRAASAFPRACPPVGPP